MTPPKSNAFVKLSLSFSVNVFVNWTSNVVKVLLSIYNHHQTEKRVFMSEHKTQCMFRLGRKPTCFIVFFFFFYSVQEQPFKDILQSKKSQYRCFPVNFEKFLRTSFLQNTSEVLLLSVPNVSQGQLPEVFCQKRCS